MNYTHNDDHIRNGYGVWPMNYEYHYDYDYQYQLQYDYEYVNRKILVFIQIEVY